MTTLDHYSGPLWTTFWTTSGLRWAPGALSELKNKRRNRARNDPRRGRATTNVRGTNRSIIVQHYFTRRDSNSD